MNTHTHTHTHTHTLSHLYVVGNGVFLQGNVDILMFGASPTCLHVLSFNNCHALHSVSSLTY